MSRETRHRNARVYHARRRDAAWAAGRSRPFCATDLWHTTEANLCGICGDIIDDRWHASIDHIMPLSRGGTETLDNVQLAHKRCNWRKGNNLPDDQTPRGRNAPLESIPA